MKKLIKKVDGVSGYEVLVDSEGGRNSEIIAIFIGNDIFIAEGINGSVKNINNDWFFVNE